MATTTLASTNPRTAVAVPAHKMKNHAGQKAPVTAKMKPTGIVNLGLGRKQW